MLSSLGGSVILWRSTSQSRAGPAVMGDLRRLAGPSLSWCLRVSQSVQLSCDSWGERFRDHVTYQSVQQSVSVYDKNMHVHLYISSLHATDRDRRAHAHRGDRYCIVTLTSLAQPLRSREKLCDETVTVAPMAHAGGVRGRGYGVSATPGPILKYLGFGVTVAKTTSSPIPSKMLPAWRSYAGWPT